MANNMKFKDKYNNLLYTKKDLYKLGFADLAALKSYVEDLIENEIKVDSKLIEQGEDTPEDTAATDAALHSLDIIKEIIDNVQEKKLESLFKIPQLSPR